MGLSSEATTGAVTEVSSAITEGDSPRLENAASGETEKEGWSTAMTSPQLRPL